LGGVGRRIRDFRNQRTVTGAGGAVTDGTVGLEEYATFGCGPLRRRDRILQLASGAPGLVFCGAVVQRQMSAGDRAANGALQRQPVASHGIRREAVVGERVDHVSPVLEPARVRCGTAAGERHRAAQGEGRPSPHYRSLAIWMMRVAPLWTSSRRAPQVSNAFGRHRKATANQASVTAAALNLAGAPGKRRRRARNAIAVVSPPARIVISNAIGMNASVELSGLPPTLSGQSNTAA